MLNKKNTVLILSLAFLIILTLLSIPVSEKIKNSFSDEDNKQFTDKHDNKNQDENIYVRPKEDYSGEIIKEENGWKRYVNEKLRIEFKFQDVDNEIVINSTKEGTELKKVKDGKDEEYVHIYIDMRCYSPKEEYLTLKDYILYYKYWDPGRGAPAPAVTKLVSVEEKNNENNVAYLKINYKYSETCWPIEGKKCDKETLYDNFVIYLDFPNRDSYCEEKYLGNIGDKGYIGLRNVSNDFGQQIINSLKFIDK